MKHPYREDRGSASSPLNRILKFFVTGGLSTLVHLSIVMFLVEAHKVHPTLSNFAAFVTATIAAYYLNASWTFQHRITAQNLWRYIIVAVFCTSVATSLSQIAYVLGLHYLTGVALIVIFVPWISYFLHRKWTFKNVS
jgi:putative flippase GtrA